MDLLYIDLQLQRVEKLKEKDIKRVTKIKLYKIFRAQVFIRIQICDVQIQSPSFI